MTKKEKHLIQRIKDGHPKAWDDFKEEYLPLIMRTINTHDFRHLVEDYMVEIIDQALKEGFAYIKKAAEIPNPSGLIYRITRRKISRFRKRSDSEKKNKPTDPLNENIPDHSPNPESKIIWEEESRELERHKKHLKICMEELTPTQRLVIELCKQGNSWAEIARMRNVTQPAISGVRDLAFKRLGDCINELSKIR